MIDPQSTVPITVLSGELGVMNGIDSANGKSVGVTHPQENLAYPITPRQYYDLFKRVERLDGEMRLLFAVLEDAIRRYTVATRSGRRSDQSALQEVKEWVGIRGDRDLFSFDSICLALDLDPHSLRRKLESLEASMPPMRRSCSVGRRGAIKPSPERGHSSLLRMSKQLLGLKPRALLATCTEADLLATRHHFAGVLCDGIDKSPAGVSTNGNGQYRIRKSIAEVTEDDVRGI